MASDDKTERTEVSAVPLYQQVMDDLKGEIARGVYASGSRIPSEMELAKYYGVGRITVRRAVEEGDTHVEFVDSELFFPLQMRDLYAVDALHPNDLGQFMMARAIYPVLEKALLREA